MVSLDTIFNNLSSSFFPFLFKGFTPACVTTVGLPEGRRAMLVIEEHHKERLNAAPR